MNKSAYLAGYTVKEEGMEKTAAMIVNTSSQNYALGQNFSMGFLQGWYDSLGKMTMDNYRKKVQKEQLRK